MTSTDGVLMVIMFILIALANRAAGWRQGNSDRPDPYTRKVAGVVHFVCWVLILVVVLLAVILG